MSRQKPQQQTILQRYHEQVACLNPILPLALIQLIESYDPIPHYFLHDKYDYKLDQQGLTKAKEAVAELEETATELGDISELRTITPALAGTHLTSYASTHAKAQFLHETTRVGLVLFRDVRQKQLEQKALDAVQQGLIFTVDFLLSTGKINFNQSYTFNFDYKEHKASKLVYTAIRAEQQGMLLYLLHHIAHLENRDRFFSEKHYFGDDPLFRRYPFYAQTLTIGTYCLLKGFNTHIANFIASIHDPEKILVELPVIVELDMALIFQQVFNLCKNPIFLLQQVKKLLPSIMDVYDYPTPLFTIMCILRFLVTNNKVAVAQLFEIFASLPNKQYQRSGQSLLLCAILYLLKQNKLGTPISETFVLPELLSFLKSNNCHAAQWFESIREDKRWTAYSQIFSEAKGDIRAKSLAVLESRKDKWTSGKVTINTASLTKIELKELKSADLVMIQKTLLLKSYDKTYTINKWHSDQVLLPDNSRLLSLLLFLNFQCFDSFCQDFKINSEASESLTVTILDSSNKNPDTVTTTTTALNPSPSSNG